MSHLRLKINKPLSSPELKLWAVAGLYSKCDGVRNLQSFIFPYSHSYFRSLITVFSLGIFELQLHRAGVLYY